MYLLNGLMIRKFSIYYKKLTQFFLNFFINIKIIKYISLKLYFKIERIYFYRYYSTFFCLDEIKRSGYTISLRQHGIITATKTIRKANRK